MLDKSQIDFVLAAGVAGGPLGSPVEDANAGGSETDVINISNYHDCYFLLLFGARSGSTAYPKITVNSCDNVTPDTSTAMAFEYRLVNSVDTNAAWTPPQMILRLSSMSRMTLQHLDGSMSRWS